MVIFIIYAEYINGKFQFPKNYIFTPVTSSLTGADYRIVHILFQLFLVGIGGGCKGGCIDLFWGHGLGKGAKIKFFKIFELKLPFSMQVNLDLVCKIFFQKQKNLTKYIVVKK